MGLLKEAQKVSREFADLLSKFEGTACYIEAIRTVWERLKKAMGE